MKNSSSKNRTAKIAPALFLLPALLVLSSCGPANYPAQSGTDQTNGSAPQYTNTTSTPTPTVTVTATPKTTTASSATSTSNKGVPAFIIPISGIGYSNAISVSVKTGKVLKVKFAPGAQDRTVAGSGFSPLYSKLGVYITVGTYTQPTEMLSNGYAGGAAQESHIMDFSTSFSNACASSDSGCRQDVIIKIGQPNYDYWCLNYNMGCPWQKVQENHPWNGTLTIQTDDTDAM